MDRNLSDDTVKLVRYSIVSIERDDERIHFRGEEIFDDNMTDDAFATWVISKHGDAQGLSAEDRKYLRVSYEVLGRWPKQDREYEKRQLEVLEGIRDAIPGHRRRKKGGAPAGGGTSGHVGGAPTEELQELQDKFGTKDVVVPGEEDPYQEFYYRLELSRPAVEEWRTNLRRANRKFADQIAGHFNKYRTVGSLEAPELDPDVLGDALGQESPAFDRESFDRFTGPALGVLRVYTFAEPGAEPVENPAPDVHSIWGPVREEDGAFVQRITGSNVEYVDPDDRDDLDSHLRKLQVDLTLNVYTEEWGMVSWSAFYQNHANQMRSFGYELGDRLLWVNQFMFQNMRPTVENQLVLSIDWEERDGDERRFNVYAMHLNFDFKKNKVEFAGPMLKLVNTVVEP